VLDIQGGDVIGEEHDLVAVELMRILGLQLGSGDMAHDIDDEVAGGDKGVEDVDAGVAQRAAELPAQELVHGADHEGDQGLGSIDDALGVGHFDGEALEEALVDRIEEGLFGGEVSQGGGGGFDGNVEAVQGFEEVSPTEVLGGKGGDDLFDLPADAP
jgi:hypothetical protein